MHRPLFNRLIIEPVLPSDQTKAGLYKPEQAKEMTMKGYVRAAGPGLNSAMGEPIPPIVKVGDKVQFSMHGIKIEPIKIKGEKRPWMVMTEPDIIAILDPEFEEDEE